jgi:DNA-binding ferritin-like protein
MTGDFDKAPGSELSVILSCAMALQHVHHTHHWQTRGSTYYGDHLLFQRLYEDLDDEIDQLAERAVGTGGVNLVNTDLVFNHAAQFVQCMKPDQEANPGPEGLAALSLSAEKCFLGLLDVAYKLLETREALSMGTDDLLQAAANLHEEHVYLLQQRAGGKVASMADRVACRARK